MPILDNTQREEVWRDLMRQAFRDLFPPNILKAGLRAAVDAADDWVETNAASFNTALPQPFRGAASVDQKIALLQFVPLRRYNRFLGN